MALTVSSKHHHPSEAAHSRLGRVCPIHSPNTLNILVGLLIHPLNPCQRLCAFIISIPAKVHIPPRRLPFNGFKLQISFREPQRHPLLCMYPPDGEHLGALLLCLELVVFFGQNELNILPLPFMEPLILCTV